MTINHRKRFEICSRSVNQSNAHQMALIFTLRSTDIFEIQTFLPSRETIPWMFVIPVDTIINNQSLGSEINRLSDSRVKIASPVLVNSFRLVLSSFVCHYRRGQFDRAGLSTQIMTLFSFWVRLGFWEKVSKSSHTVLG